MTQEQGPRHGGDVRAEVIRGFLPRSPPGASAMTTHSPLATAGAHVFRLQLFTAPGTRPLAVVIQRHGGGPSVFKAAERYAEAVWQRHCPGQCAAHSLGAMARPGAGFSPLDGVTRGRVW